MISWLTCSCQPEPAFEEATATSLHLTNLEDIWYLSISVSLHTLSPSCCSALAWHSGRWGRAKLQLSSSRSRPPSLAPPASHPQSGKESILCKTCSKAEAGESSAAFVKWCQVYPRGGGGAELHKVSHIKALYILYSKLLVSYSQFKLTQDIKYSQAVTISGLVLTNITDKKKEKKEAYLRCWNEGW